MELTAGIKKRRLLTMLSGAFAIFFTGFPHVWSIYQPYVMAQAGWTQNQASMCFYLALGTFVFGNIAGGRIQDRYHPRIAVMIGGGIFTAGICLSGFLIMGNPIPFYLTYGVMQGFGQGMMYTTILSTAQKWFPGRSGFASGVVVTANGLCGFFLAPVSRALLERGGLQTAFLTVGGAAGIAWILGSLFIQVPVGTETGVLDSGSARGASCSGKQYTAGEMLRSGKFYLLLATMTFALLPYFILSPVSQTLQLEQGVSPRTAVAAVMLGSAVNAAARLLLPTIADKIGRLKCIGLVLAAMLTAMLMLAVSSYYITTAAVILTYGCYGGLMGSFPSLTSDIFGMKHSGENYGYVMFGITLATFGAPVLTTLLTHWGLAMQRVFLTGAGLVVLAVFSMLRLSKCLKNHKVLT